MNAYQVKFKIVDEKYDIAYGGIYVKGTDNEYVICGCCGHIFSIEEVEIIERYEDWIDLTNEIVGDEL